MQFWKCKHLFQKVDYCKVNQRMERWLSKKLSTLVALAESPDSVTSTHMVVPWPSIIPVPGDTVPSSDQAHM